MKKTGALRRYPAEFAARHAYERLLPGEMETQVKKAPVAYVAAGLLEFHGPHLPFGVDILVPDRLIRRAVLETGGIVLPPIYVGSGGLRLPYTINFPLETLRLTIRALLQQLLAAGFRVIVVMSGHGALDHLHVLREECDRLMSEHSGARAIATCWNELTVDVEGDIHDHGAKVETSYMLELCAELVKLENLANHAEATFPGIYGPNPLFTASQEWGSILASRAVAALVKRVDGALDSAPVDNWADLRRLIQRLQAGDLILAQDSGRVGENGLVFELENVQSQSKYITAVRSFRWDGALMSSDGLIFHNRTAGEERKQTAAALGPLSGFYIRRQQRATVELPSFRPAPGNHDLFLELELAGVLAVKATGSLQVVPSQ